MCIWSLMILLNKLQLYSSFSFVLFDLNLLFEKFLLLNLQSSFKWCALYKCFSVSVSVSVRRSKKKNENCKGQVSSLFFIIAINAYWLKENVKHEKRKSNEIFEVHVKILGGMQKQSEKKTRNERNKIKRETNDVNKHVEI